MSPAMPTHLIGDSQVGVVGYGSMNLTWAPKQTDDERAFACFKTAIDASPALTNVNSGEFYGAPRGTMGLELLSRFFAAEPAYADKVFLSVKGGLAPNFSSDSSEENLRKSVQNINDKLGSRKMDLFECARVDTSRPIEETIRTLKKLIDEGHFKHIGLSEVSATTIRRAHAVHPIAAVEMEYSFWSTEIESNGVMATCKELNIPLISYSPLGRGFLAGSIKSRSDIPEGDMRLMFDRFSVENFPKNLEIVDKLAVIAAKKSITLAQLAVGWTIAMGTFPIPGSTRPEGVKESLEGAFVSFTEGELKEIRAIIDETTIIGGRYNSHMEGGLTQ